MRVLPVLLLTVGAFTGCSRQLSQSSVTVTLPPPKAAVAPGFGPDAGDRVAGQE